MSPSFENDESAENHNAFISSAIDPETPVSHTATTLVASVAPPATEHEEPPESRECYDTMGTDHTHTHIPMRAARVQREVVEVNGGSHGQGRGPLVKGQHAVAAQWREGQRVRAHVG